MIEFKTFSPAETKLLLECGKAELKELMKLTFMDLILKKVLKIVDVDKRLHPRDEVRTYTYVETDENFKKYTPKNHELAFMNAFIKENDIQILFKNLIKSAYVSAGGSKSYRKTIRRNKHLKHYFKESTFVNIFGLIRLTPEGEKKQKDIIAYLEKTDKEISNYVRADQEKALEVVMCMGGNIFLLKNLELPLLKKIDKELIKQKKATISNTYDTTDGWFFYEGFFGDNSLFDDEFDEAYSFDSFFTETMDFFDTEFDASSCSSCDSGCTSCGGCGGCGGCGD